MSARAVQHSPSAWASFVPKLTKMFTVAETNVPRRVLANALEYGDAIVQHDSGVQTLARVSVAFHNALGRSVVDSACFFANETRLEQHLQATETFGARSDDVSVEVDLSSVSQAKWM